MSVEVKFNEDQLAKLRTDPGVVKVIEDKIDEWRDEANATLAEGEGYESAVHRDESKRGPYTVGRLWTRSQHAKNSNAKHQTLPRIVGR